LKNYGIETDSGVFSPKRSCGSLNEQIRKKELKQINTENRRFLRKLNNVQPKVLTKN
jgi:hypothetical protein